MGFRSNDFVVGLQMTSVEFDFAQIMGQNLDNYEYIDVQVTFLMMLIMTYLFQQKNICFLARKIPSIVIVVREIRTIKAAQHTKKCCLHQASDMDNEEEALESFSYYVSHKYSSL